MFPVYLVPPPEWIPRLKLAGKPLVAEWVEKQLGCPVYGEDQLPLGIGEQRVTRAAKRLAADIAPYLMDGAPAIVPPLPTEGFRVLLCPSAGSAEGPRRDLQADLSGVQDFTVSSLEPRPLQVAETLAVGEAGLAVSELSVHFFGPEVRWKVAEIPLNLALLAAAVRNTARGHQVLVWIAAGCPHESQVTDLLRKASADRVRIAAGTRDDLRRSVLTMVQQARRPVPTGPLLVLLMAQQMPATLQINGPMVIYRMQPNFAEMLQMALKTHHPSGFLLVPPEDRKADSLLVALGRRLDLEQFAGERWVWTGYPTVGAWKVWQ